MTCRSPLLPWTPPLDSSHPQNPDLCWVFEHNKLILDQDIQALPEEEPRPSLYSRLFSWDKPVVSGTGGWIPYPGVNHGAAHSSFDEDETTIMEYDGDDVVDVQADCEDEN